MSVFRFIEAEKAEFPISLCCRVLGVSRSGFHAWRTRAPSRRALEDDALRDRIRQIHTGSRGTYGSPRVHAELRFDGVRVGRKRVERLMRQSQLSGSSSAAAAAPRSASQASASPTTSSSATSARRPRPALGRVGWSLADHLRAPLVVDALELAVARRRPQRGLVHHSDQGSQYVSLAFGRRCRESGIEPSIGSKGDAYDNAVCESFFKTLKSELLDRRSWPDRHEARTAIFEFNESFYNRQRRHSTLGYLSPHDYEKISQRQLA